MKIPEKTFNVDGLECDPRTGKPIPGGARVVPRVKRSGPNILEQIYKEQGGVCFLCLGRLPPIDDTTCDKRLRPTLEHVVPVSKGGTNKWENLTVAHSWCNNEKGSKDPDSTLLARLRYLKTGEIT